MADPLRSGAIFSMDLDQLRSPEPRVGRPSAPSGDPLRTGAIFS
eukprot:CAMPEP_0119280508 /NCGR_PEP_ID=MMETSP1329-20130426/22784_1 /TAXON_ID=114041 /ORGANISM="Genus nov. species nov., Strain RCC1024" /LENGTH=43 /DNA_ID= /DNA_START= /DNA_END= /DNA_ORIENTATION=